MKVCRLFYKKQVQLETNLNNVNNFTRELK